MDGRLVGADPFPAAMGATVTLVLDRGSLSVRAVSGADELLDSGTYSVTEMGVRTRLGAGSEAFGKYQIAGIDGGRNAALVGLRNRIALGESWTLNALMERRQGIGRASVFDPVRALPFRTFVTLKANSHVVHLTGYPIRCP